MKTGTVPIFTWVGIIFLFMMLLSGCNGGKDKVSSAAATAESVGRELPGNTLSDVTILAVEDLDNAANPFAGQYREWDYWLVEHQLPEGVPNGYVGDLEGNMGMVGYLDTDGWLWPSLAVERAMEEAAKAGEGRDFLEQLQNHVYASGDMEQELIDERMQEICNIKASYYPPIPAFLGTNPPRRTMLVSTDRIVTIGLPGSGSLVDPYQQDPYAPPQEALPFYLWDREGNQLGETTSVWFELFGAPIQEINRTAREAGCNTKFLSSVPMGYLGYNDAATGDLKLLYDYDGTPIEPDISLHKRDEHNFMFISADELSHMYETQQLLGMRGEDV